MEAHLEKILLEADQIEGKIERPDKFDYLELESQINAYSAALENELGNIYTIYYEAQDASYIGRVNAYRLPDETKQHPLLGVIFSKFGRLASVYELEYVSESSMNTAISMLNDYGFTYIPDNEEVMSAKYTGRHSVREGFTWRDRFFNEL